MEERYYVLRVAKPKQDIPFKINQRGGLQVLCSCEHTRLNPSGDGSRNYVFNLDSDGDLNNYERQKYGRRRVLVSTTPVKRHPKIVHPNYNITTHSTPDEIERYTRIKLSFDFPRDASIRQISKRKLDDIKSGRSLRAALSFASARYHYHR